MPVQNGHQVQKALVQPDIRNIGRPNLVRSFDVNLTQQIRKNPMLRTRLTQTRAGVNSLDPQHPHQAFHPLVIDRPALLAQPFGQARRSVKRGPRVLLIQQPQVQQVLRAFLGGLVVKTGTGQTGQLTLSADAQLRMPLLNPASLASSSQARFFFNQSSSTFNWPICW